MRDIISVEDIILNCNNYKKVIGIGETGIDLFHIPKIILFNHNIISFKNHIEASIRNKTSIDCTSKRILKMKIIEILSSYKNDSLPLVMHCFTGSKKLRDFCIDANYYISLSGIVTFNNANELREIVKGIPLKLITYRNRFPIFIPSTKARKNSMNLLLFVIQQSFFQNFLRFHLSEFENITDNNFYNLFSKAIRYKEITT